MGASTIASGGPGRRRRLEVLLERHRLEIQIFEFDDVRYVRITCQAYNEPDDYDRLAHALLTESRA